MYLYHTPFLHVPRTLHRLPGGFVGHEEATSSYLKLKGNAGIYASDLKGIPTELDLAVGAASPEIYEAARLEKVDLIALATHGRSGLLHLVMGTVTEHLLGATKLPIFIVRPSAELAEKTRQEKDEALQAENKPQSWVGLL